MTPADLELTPVDLKLTPDLLESIFEFLIAITICTEKVAEHLKFVRMVKFYL